MNCKLLVEKSFPKDTCQNLNSFLSYSQLKIVITVMLYPVIISDRKFAWLLNEFCYS